MTLPPIREWEDTALSGILSETRALGSSVLVRCTSRVPIATIWPMQTLYRCINRQIAG